FVSTAVSLTTVKPNTRQYHSVLRSRSETVRLMWVVPSRFGTARTLRAIRTFREVHRGLVGSRRACRLRAVARGARRALPARGALARRDARRALALLRRDRPRADGDRHRRGPVELRGARRPRRPRRRWPATARRPRPRPGR